MSASSYHERGTSEQGVLAFVCAKCLGIVIPWASWRELFGAEERVAVDLQMPAAAIIAGRLFVHLNTPADEHDPPAVVGRGFAA